MTAITLDGVTKAFGDTTVLDDLDLFVADGELMVLLGPSGSGKSTVLRLIAGLESVTEGRIFFDGENVTAVPTSERNVAMVLQDLGLYAHLTAGENIGFPLAVRKVHQAEVDVRVEEEAGKLGLARLLGRRPGELAAGHRHGVATGRALVRESAVLLMDEPLAQLDAPVRRRIRREIARTQRELGNTIVYVTNDSVEAMALGHRVAVFDHGGALQQVGQPFEVYRHPANVFVGQFIGTLSIVPAAVERDEDGVWLGVGNDRLLVDDDALDRYAGNAVLAGFRPEHLRPSRPGDPFSRCLHTTVRAVENLGSSLLIHAMVGTTEVIAESDADISVRPGDSLELAVNPERIRYFDPGTEMAVS